MKLAYRLVTIGLLMSTAAAFLMVYNIRHDKEALQRRLNDICGVARAGLEGTIQAIKGNRNREAAISRIHGEGDVTGSVVLRGCTPDFDPDRWHVCVANNDEPCMLRMLEDALKSLPQ